MKVIEINCKYSCSDRLDIQYECRDEKTTLLCIQDFYAMSTLK